MLCLLAGSETKSGPGSLVSKDLDFVNKLTTLASNKASYKKKKNFNNGRPRKLRRNRRKRTGECFPEWKTNELESPDES